MNKKQTISEKELGDHLSKLLLPKSDLLVHSSLSAFGKIESSPERIVNIIQEILGPQSTLLMSGATTQQFSVKKIFSLDTVPETGILSRALLEKRGSLRSKVPMASFIANGPAAKQYTEAYQSMLDPTSPLVRLLEADGQIMLFGVGYNKCSLYHLAEERCMVPYNYLKEFAGTFVDEIGQTSPICQKYYVRRSLALKKDVNKAFGEFDNHGAKVGHIGTGTIRSFSAVKFDEFCQDRISKNIEILIS